MFNICYCGAAAGYDDHAPDCPYPLFRCGEAAENKWLAAREQKLAEQGIAALELIGLPAMADDEALAGAPDCLKCEELNCRSCAKWQAMQAAREARRQRGEHVPSIVDEYFDELRHGKG